MIAITGMIDRWRSRRVFAVERRYAQATASLGEIWRELYRVDDPAERAELLERAAQLQDERVHLLPVAYDPNQEEFAGTAIWPLLRAFPESAAVLRQVAATERALIGEFTTPARPADSRLAFGPAEVLLWVDLAATEDRAERAALLLKLCDLLAPTISQIAAETLALIAETEVRLAATLGFERAETGTRPVCGALLTPAELAQAVPVQAAPVQVAMRSRRSIGAVFFGVVGLIWRGGRLS